MSSESSPGLDYIPLIRNCLAAFLLGYIVGIDMIPILP